jgi:hypothetical protein
MSDFHNIEGYEPLFELGIFKKESPGCRVIPEEAETDPIMLAALVVALFETVMGGVPESEQNAFEEKFHEALAVMMEERFDYEVFKKYPEDNDDEYDEEYDDEDY